VDRFDLARMARLYAGVYEATRRGD